MPLKSKMLTDRLCSCRRWRRERVRSEYVVRLSSASDTITTLGATRISFASLRWSFAWGGSATQFCSSLLHLRRPSSAAAASRRSLRAPFSSARQASPFCDLIPLNREFMGIVGECGDRIVAKAPRVGRGDFVRCVDDVPETGAILL